MEAIKSIGVVVIDYNSHERTKIYLEDLIFASDMRLESIVVVDNSPSVENTINIARFFMLPEINLCNLCDEIQRYCVDRAFIGVYKDTEIILLHSADNLGFARGNNLGFVVLQKLCKIDYVLFTNNDILFSEKRVKISRLIDVFSEETRVGVVGPAVVGLDGQKQTPCKYIGLYERVWKNFYLSALPFFHDCCTSDIINEPRRGYVYRIIGAFFVVDANIFAEIGMFDENTFLYAEELILADRLREHKYEVFYEPCVLVTHEGGYTTEKDGKVNVKNKVRIRKTIIQSNTYYYEKYRKYSKLSIALTRLMGVIHCMLLGAKLSFQNLRGKN